MPSYLVIPGIQGDSQARGHEGSIEIESWSFGVAQAEQRGAGSGRPVGRGTFSDATFACRGGRASPLLLQFCATGRQVAQAVLTQQPGTAGGQSATTEARFTDVRVERYTARGDDGDTHDEFTLGYAQVTFSVRPQLGDGAPADAISTTQPAAVPATSPPPIPTPGSGGIWRPRDQLRPPR